MKLPNMWKILKFGEIAKFNLGKTPPRNNPDYWEDGFFPWVAISDMKEFGFIPSTEEKIAQKAFKEALNEKYTKKGTLLMSFKLTIGRTAILDIDAVHNEAIISIYPNEKVIDKYFLFYYLPIINYQNYYDKAVKGNTLNKSKIENLKILVPPLPEQKAIAFVLSTIQTAKEKTEQVIQATKELKKSMMKHLFTYGPVSLEDVEKIKLKETEIGKMPAEWGTKKLVEVARITMGQSPPGSTYNISGKGKPFLQGKAEFGFLHPKHVKCTTKPLKIAKKGSVLLSVRAPVGDVNLVDQEYCIGRGLSSISLIEGDNIFLFYILNYLKLKIESEGTGSTFKAINKSKIENLKILVPPLSTQQKIASILSTIDEKIQAEENKKKALEALFKSMLHNLMTGKIRVNYLEVKI